MFKIFAEFYFEILTIFATVAAVVFVLLFANMLLQWAWAMIDDRKYMANDYITKKWLSMCPGMDKTTSKWVHIDGDISWIPFPIFGFIAMVFAFILTWPASAIVATIYGTLLTLRSGNRVRKNVSKLNKIAHDHKGKEIVRF